ncbi:MAG: ATP-binding protein [Phycisphaerae bacterium]
MIKRDLFERLRSVAARSPSVTLTGPRQSGKSTLCKQCFPKHDYCNFEAPDVRAFAADDPRAFLGQFKRGAILDEIQRTPHLPSYLQELIDRDPSPGRWILTGSQNLALSDSVSQSLAGRTAVMHLLPLARSEARRFESFPTSLDNTLLTGGYPRIFNEGLAAADWISSYVATYVERDVRSISNIGDLGTFQRFLGLCAGRSAQLLNLSSIATDCGISQPTAKAWLSVLEASFLIVRLPAFHANISKRLVKMAKLHFLDSGLHCWLLGIRNAKQLARHPLRGAIFESWVVSEIIKHRINRGESGGVWHWRDQHGVEADLLVERDGEIAAIVEAKAGQTVASDAFAGLRRIRPIIDPKREVRSVLVYAGSDAQNRSDVSVVPWDELDRQEWA